MDMDPERELIAVKQILSTLLAKLQPVLNRQSRARYKEPRNPFVYGGGFRDIHYAEEDVVELTFDHVPLSALRDLQSAIIEAYMACESTPPIESFAHKVLDKAALVRSRGQR